MPHLVQILLPLRDNEGAPFPPEMLRAAAKELTERFGGVTAFTRSPAEGLWLDEREDARRDDVVVYEVMVPELDKAWWSRYRSALEARFDQEVVVLRAIEITEI